MKRGTVLVMLLVLLSIAARSTDIAEYFFRQINGYSGLSNGIVYSIQKDRNGYLWIGTTNGLNYFDGRHMRVWKHIPNDSTSLSFNRIQNITEDNSGNIWCLTDAGISRYDKRTNTFINYKLRDPEGKEIRGKSFSLCSLPDGTIIATSVNYLFLLKPGERQFKSLPLPEGHEVYFRQSILLAGESIWLASAKGLLEYLPEKQKFNTYLADNHITAMAEQSGKLYCYLANQKALSRFDVSTRTFEMVDCSIYINSGHVNCIYADRSGKLWISTTASGLYTSENFNGEWKPFKHEPENEYSIASDYFDDVFEDSDGTLYFGTLNGISFLNLSTAFFSIHKLPEGTSHKRSYYISSLLNADRDNNLWLAPSYHHLLKYNSHTGEYTHYDFFPHHKYDQNLKITTLETDDKNIYAGTLDGIYIYSPSAGNFVPLVSNEDISGRYILAMELTKSGDLWFTSHRNGVYRYNSNSRELKHYLHDEKNPLSFTNNYIFDIHENKDGSVWFAAEADGLIRFRESTGDFENVFRNRSDVSHEYYTALANDTSGNIWLLNYMTGLIRYNPGDRSAHNMSTPKLSAFSYNAMEADNNRLWLAANAEYSILDMTTGSAVNHTVNYSLNPKDYANHFVRMNNGLMAAETYNGVILFNPDRIKATRLSDPLNISAIISDTLSLLFPSTKNEISLSHRQNSFSIDYSSLSYLKNPDLRFFCMLEGYDDDWVNMGNRQSVYYTNVPGGTYRFMVRLVNPSDDRIISETSLPVRVGSVFYSTTWFKIALLFMLAGLTYWYQRLYAVKQQKERAEDMITYFANSMRGADKVEEILWDIAHNVIERSAFVDCVIYMIDKDRNVLVQKAAYGNKNPEAYKILSPIEIPVGKGIVGSVAQSGTPEIIADTSKDSRYIADDERRFSEMAVPIKAAGEVIGVIDSEHPRKNYFTRDHLELMSTIASITGNKVMNARKEMELRDKEKHVEGLRLQMAYARQQALRSQMNPHFIFNCLNSINGFILKNDAATASAYLIKFSKLIRLILEHSTEKSIPLQSELEALQLYIEMESLRFENKFRFSITVDEEVMPDVVKVPPLIFQPFVENAIWHGLLHKTEPGSLSVNISMNGKLQCIIEDNGIGREASASLRANSNISRKSLGMKLTRERLQILNEEEKDKTSLNIIDLKDDTGKAAGTKVIIKLSV